MRSPIHVHLEHDGPRPFSPAVRVGDLVFVSGQASTSETGEVIYADFAAEMHRSIANLRRVLQACGGELCDVVLTRNYVKHGSDLSAFNTIYREYFRQPYPARTTLTGCLDKLKYEIDAIAAIPARAAKAESNGELR